MIITAEIAENIDQRKFIPVLRDGNWKSALPAWIKTRFGVDLSATPYSEEEYENLLRALHREPLKAPEIGPKPPLGQGQGSRPSILPGGAPETAARPSLRLFNFGGTPGPLLVSGKQHSVHGPEMDLWCLVTVVNYAQGPMKVGPVRLVVDGAEWPEARFFFRLKSNPKERFDRISIVGNHKEDYELHFMFADNNYPQSRSGHLLLETDSSDRLANVDVKFS